MRELKKFSMRKASNFLSEAEMKRVTGGYGDRECVQYGIGTCGWADDDTGYCICGMPKEVVLDYVNHNGGWWCCDSCGSSTYCS